MWRRVKLALGIAFSGELPAVHRQRRWLFAGSRLRLLIDPSTRDPSLLFGRDAGHLFFSVVFVFFLYFFFYPSVEHRIVFYSRGFLVLIPIYCYLSSLRSSIVFASDFVFTGILGFLHELILLFSIVVFLLLSQISFFSFSLIPFFIRFSEDP